MIAALLLTDPGDRLLFEDPGPVIARNLFESLDRKIVHTLVDDEGMDFEQIVQQVPRLRMAFTTPSPFGKDVVAGAQVKADGLGAGQ